MADAIQRCASERAEIQRKWVYGFHDGGKVTTWTTSRRGEEKTETPEGWTEKRDGVDEVDWYTSEPKARSAEDDAESNTSSRYLPDEDLKIAGEDDAKMTITVVVNDAWLGGHAHVAFEWFEAITPTESEELVVKRHVVFHLEGKARDASKITKVLSAIGYGPPGKVAKITPRFAGDVEITRSDSDPDFFFARDTQAHYRTWAVAYEVGAGAFRIANDSIGDRDFSLLPVWPSTYNCAQMAQEIAQAAGLNPLGFIGTVLPSWAIYLQGGANPTHPPARD